MRPIAAILAFCIAFPAGAGAKAGPERPAELGPRLVAAFLVNAERQGIRFRDTATFRQTVTCMVGVLLDSPLPDDTLIAYAAALERDGVTTLLHEQPALREEMRLRCTPGRG